LIQKSFQSLENLKDLDLGDYLPVGFKNAIEYLLSLVSQVNNFVELTIEIFSDLAEEHFKLSNAFICGLINGLIELFEFIFQIISFLIGLDGLVSVGYDDLIKKRYQLEIVENVLNFLFKEVPLLLNVFLDLAKNIKDLNFQELENIFELFKEIFQGSSGKLDNISRYQWAYYSGSIIFEIIVGIVLALLTGGLGNAGKAAGTISQKGSKFLKILGEEFISAITFGASDLLSIFSSLTKAFAKACKNGFRGFIEWIRSLLKRNDKHLDEVLELEEVVIETHKPLKSYNPAEVKHFIKDVNFHNHYGLYDLQVIRLRAKLLNFTLVELQDFVKTGSLMKIKKSSLVKEMEFFAKQKKNKFALQKPKSIKGRHSQRDFDLNNCGGEILNLDWKNIEIFEEGFSIVKSHLERFESVEANRKMIKRLEDIIYGKIKPTDWDKRFYTHEIREYRRYKNLGIEDGVEADYDIWNHTHSSTLEDYKIYELDENRNSILYHPDIKPEDFDY